MGGRREGGERREEGEGDVIIIGSFLKTPEDASYNY